MTDTTTSAKRARTTSMAFINSCTPPTLPRLPLLGLVVGALLRSLDHPIRPLQERRRDRQAERLGGLEVDHQFELGRLLDGEVNWFRALEDLIHEGGRAPKQVSNVRSIGHEATGIDIRPE